MAKYIIRFSKDGYIRYTSHLDMIRLFKRCFKKAGIKLVYSTGFNPHPKMVFAQPLSLGYYSIGEVMEIETQEDIPCGELQSRLSDALPKGMSVLNCSLQTEAKSFASRVDEATYKIAMEIDPAYSLERIEEFFNQDEINVKKAKKKKKHEFRTINIKEKIRDYKVELVNDKLVMVTRLDAGSESNLNPDLLLGAFFEFFGLAKDEQNVEITRLELACK